MTRKGVESYLFLIYIAQFGCTRNENFPSCISIVIQNGIGDSIDAFPPCQIFMTEDSCGLLKVLSIIPVHSDTTPVVYSRVRILIFKLKSVNDTPLPPTPHREKRIHPPTLPPNTQKPLKANTKMKWFRLISFYTIHFSPQSTIDICFFSSPSKPLFVNSVQWDTSRLSKSLFTN